MDISCALAPVHDTPALQLDVWMTLARAADRTARIGLAPGVLIPSLRHVLVTASALATLVQIAPGRVTAGIGSGFTGRVAMGQRPNAWTFVADYARQLRALLAGETIEVDGGLARMIHGPGQAPPRPLSVPFVFAVGGKKGQEAARALADGIITVVPTPGFDWSVLLTFGTVLDPGESFDAPRVLAAAGPGAAIVFHRAYDRVSDLRFDIESLPGGASWKAAIEAFPARERHLHMHEGHHTYLNEVDRGVITGEAVRRFTFTDQSAALRARYDALAAQGVTEIAYHPAGPDIERELATFARMMDMA